MSNIFDKRLNTCLIIIAISILIYLLISSLFGRIINRHKKNSKRLTYIKLLRNTVKYIIILIDILYILYIYGINVTSIAAGLGIVTLVVTLSLQDALKDIISGFNLIIDDYFNAGDVVIIDGIKGKVLEIGLKTTKLKDITTDNIYIVANRNLSSAIKLSNNLDIDLPLPYELKLKDAEKVLKIIITSIKNTPGVKDCLYIGLQTFGDSAIFYKIRIIAHPEDQWQIERDSKGIIKGVLEKEKIDIPYNQIDIHNK